jgi:hypothetical protein
MKRIRLFLSFLCLFEWARAFLLPTSSRHVSFTFSHKVPSQPPSSSRPTLLFATDKTEDDKEKPKKSKKNYYKSKQQSEKEKKKQQVAKAAAELRRDKQQQSNDDKDDSLLGMLDPFKAGKKFRKTINTALTTIGAASSGGLTQERRSVYFVDDRFLEPGGALFSERNPLLERMEEDGYVPEVLVIGATGEVGRLVVRRLLLDGRFRVRVLVRDLYSKTLNLLGTGVTYCQGDLGNVESLEYALTDVDKIVFCAGAPRPDETDFQDKFQTFVQENLDNATNVPSTKTKSDLEWEQLEGVLKVRAKLAEQVDCIGMQNLVRAYQNVRHADYGTSQAAKRSLFKFQDRPEDFNIFTIDDEDLEGELEEEYTKSEPVVEPATTREYSSSTSYLEEDEDNEDDDVYDGDDYEDTYADDDYPDYDDDDHAVSTTMRKGAAVQTQCQWIRNKFKHGVFVGKVPRGTGEIGGEASIVSSRLRSREEPEMGIDLSNGFAGFVCRVCSDGGRYEAFVRSGNYGTDGIEYVCEFATEIKQRQKGNKSRNKFKTVRLPFVNFKPVQRREKSGEGETVAPPFKGKDVRQIGFRYRSENNPEKAKFEKGSFSSFYLALSYIKVYRSQPEPEFVYLSDARIPPVLTSNMVRHDVHQLVTTKEGESEDEDSYQLLDQAALTSVAANPMTRSAEETYYKYRGEEILKNSGLSYTIVRVCGFNEVPSGEASTIDLKQSNHDMMAVSRAEVAQVCAEALLDPNALNKSLYMSKRKRKSKDLQREEDLSSRFAVVPPDPSR